MVLTDEVPPNLKIFVSNDSTQRYCFLAGPALSISGHQQRGQIGLFQGQEEKGKDVRKPVLKKPVRAQGSSGAQMSESGKPIGYSMQKLICESKPFNVKDDKDAIAEKPSSNKLITIRTVGINISVPAELPSLQVANPGQSPSFVHSPSPSSP